MAHDGDVGGICALESCGRRDYLPFPCNGCGKSFCKEHRSVTAHACPSPVFESGSEPSSTTAAPSEPMAKFTCALAACDVTDFTRLGVACERCANTFCLKHRHPTDHKCTVPAPVPERHRRPEIDKSVLAAIAGAGAGVGATASAGAGGNSSGGGCDVASGAGGTGAAVKTRRKPKKPLTEKQLALKRKVALTRLKSKARGKDKITSDRRFYLEVEVPESSEKKPLPMCFDMTTTVGRVVDDVAALTGLRNRNNESIPEEERLYLFPEGGEHPLPYGHKLCELMDAGHGVQSADTVELRRGLS